MKKLATILVSMVMVLVLASASVFAVTESSHYKSTSGTAGTYHSETSHSVTSKTLSSVCGGDVGAYFYSTNVGLQASFVKDTNRKIYAKVYEYDSDTGKSIHARTRRGTFKNVNGVYRPNVWSYTYTYSKKIEADSSPELYLSWKIDKVRGDRSTSIPAKLLEYSFWVY